MGRLISLLALLAFRPNYWHSSYSLSISSGEVSPDCPPVDYTGSKSGIKFTVVDEDEAGRIRLCSCNWLAGLSHITVSPPDQQCGDGNDRLLPLEPSSLNHWQCVLVDHGANISYFKTPERSLTLCPVFNSIPATNHSLRSIARIHNDLLPYRNVENQGPTVVTGLRVEQAEKGISFDDDQVAVVLAGSPVSIRLFGHNFDPSTEFRFVWEYRLRGDDCDNLPFLITTLAETESLTNNSAIVQLRFPGAELIDSNLEDGMTPGFYLCVLQQLDNGRNHWVHQGGEPGVTLRTFERSLPLWLQVVFIVVLLSLSGLFSGLNLGLMALDRTELKIYENTGTEKEKRYAATIIPVRNHGNYLLCTLLLGNVLVNSTLTIFLDDLTSGVIAIVGSTMGIVILGEIIPQAVCSRFGLAIGAHTVWITKFFMLVTFPVSYPISLILDLILGKEIGSYYNRERLKELIQVTKDYHDLEKEEVNIIAGALEMRRKTVGDVMTHLDDAFMLSVDSVLDFETVSEIMKQGFSRVPVYENERNNVVALLYIKELALVDPEDATPIKTVCQFYQNKLNFVMEDTTLDVVFKEFKEGNKGHLAFVQRRLIDCEGGDASCVTIGLVTLEDVIEELIQAEILDETDVWLDNRSKRRREKGKLLQDFSNYVAQYREQKASYKVSPQLALAAFQFLSSSIAPFSTEFVSENVYHRLVRQGLVVRFIRVKDGEDSKSDPDTFIYQQGKPVDYFVLILEGRVEVRVGKENLIFESGPFSYFGSQILSNPHTVDHARSSSHLFRGSVHSIAINDKRANSVGGFEMDIQSSRNHSYETVISDYTVRAVTDVVYFRINRMLYKAAVNATQFEKAHGSAAALTVSSSSTNQPRSNWTNATQEEERRYSTSSTNQRPSLTDFYWQGDAAMNIARHVTNNDADCLDTTQPALEVIDSAGTNRPINGPPTYFVPEEDNSVIPLNPPDDSDQGKTLETP